MAPTAREEFRKPALWAVTPSVVAFRLCSPSPRGRGKRPGALPSPRHLTTRWLQVESAPCEGSCLKVLFFLQLSLFWLGSIFPLCKHDGQRFNILPLIPFPPRRKTQRERTRCLRLLTHTWFLPLAFGFLNSFGFLLPLEGICSRFAGGGGGDRKERHLLNFLLLRFSLGSGFGARQL